MRIRRFPVALAACTVLCSSSLTGCQADAKLYPVEGPLAQLTPMPVFAAKVTGGIKLDNFYATIADGEKVSCAFTENGGKRRISDAASPVANDSFNMGPAWDAVYGGKFYEAHVLGSSDPYYRCLASGDKGTTLHVAIQVGLNANVSRSENVKGVVADDKGNIYKIAL